MPPYETVTFADEPIDRAAHLRKAEAQATLLKSVDAQCLILWRGKPLFNPGDTPALAWVPMDHPILQEAQEQPIFLGMEDGAPRFAADISAWEDPAADKDEMGRFLDGSENRHPTAPDQVFLEMRALLTELDAGDAGSAATAKGIWAWHATHTHCARCGAKTEICEAGWQRRCTACGGSHFPRTDPVVIMLVLHGNKVLLGRSPNWPERMYSLLAGFMEPGESIEAAVRRETKEEAGIEIGRIGYLASQPWPFPASLMIGCWAEATSSDITVDPVELEDAVWMTREEVMEAQHDANPRLRPARKGALAHHLIHMWLRGEAGIPSI